MKARKRRSGRETWVPYSSWMRAPVMCETDKCHRSSSSSPSLPSCLYVPALLLPTEQMATDQAQLPLSFIASFLALDIDVFPTDPETGNRSWPIGQASGYLCTSTPAPPPPSQTTAR